MEEGKKKKRKRKAKWEAGCKHPGVLASSCRKPKNNWAKKATHEVHGVDVEYNIVKMKAQKASVNNSSA